MCLRSDSELLPRFLAEAMKLHSVRAWIESRLTGTSPTIKNISRPSLLDLEFPLPDVKAQKRLLAGIAAARDGATQKRIEADTLRNSAWPAFESALLTPFEPGAA